MPERIFVEHNCIIGKLYSHFFRCAYTYRVIIGLNSILATRGKDVFNFQTLLVLIP